MRSRYPSIARLSRLLMSCSVGVALAACSSETNEARGVDTQSIIRGADSTAVNDAVVEMSMRKGNKHFRCTGTLIARNLVLTARHCISDKSVGKCNTPESDDPRGNTRPFKGTMRPEDVSIYTGVAGNADGGAAAAVGAKFIFSRVNNSCTDDIVLILLKNDVVGVPIASVELEKDVKPQDSVAFVGWGRTIGEHRPAMRQERQNVLVERVGPAPAFTWNNPVTRLDETVGYVSAKVFKVGESICSGDSGGPAFNQDGKIVGVVRSGGGGDEEDNPAPGVENLCVGGGNFNHITMTKPFGDVVRSALREANGTPDQPAAAAGGASGSCAMTPAASYSQGLFLYGLVCAGLFAIRRMRGISAED